MADIQIEATAYTTHQSTAMRCGPFWTTPLIGYVIYLDTDRDLNLLVNGGNRSISLSGDLTVEAASLIDQDLTADASPEWAEVVLTPSESALSVAKGGMYFCSADDSVYVCTSDE